MGAEQELSQIREVTLPTPNRAIEIPLSEGSTLRMETYVRGVVGHWGRRYSEDETHALVAKEFSEDEVESGTGFSEIWRVPPGTTNERAIEDELDVASRLIKETLRIHDLSPEDIEFMFLGSGFPIVDHPDVIRYSRTIAELNGMGHLVPEDPYDPSAPLFDRYLACYSGASGMRDALLDPELQGQIGLFLNMEGLTRNGIEQENLRKAADALSFQFFSNGASAFIMKPGETFKLVLDEEGNPIEEETVVPDVHNALPALVSYSHLMDQDALKRGGSIVQTHGNTKMIKLPEPTEGVIRMNGGRTGELFVGKKSSRMPARVKRVFDRYRQAYPDRISQGRTLRTNVHPAGRAVVETLDKRTHEDLTFQWGLKPDGNTSASASTIVLIRDGENYERGDHIISVAMGAGSMHGVLMLEVG